jgi:hypothetical protein
MGPLASDSRKYGRELTHSFPALARALVSPDLHGDADLKD